MYFFLWCASSHFLFRRFSYEFGVWATMLSPSGHSGAGLAWVEGNDFRVRAGFVFFFENRSEYPTRVCFGHSADVLVYLCVAGLKSRLVPAMAMSSPASTRYPGPFSSLHHACAAVLASQHLICGVRFTSSAYLVTHFAAMTHFEFDQGNSMCKFSARAETQETEAFSALTCSFNPVGIVSASVIRQWNSIFDTNATLDWTQASHDWACHAEADMKGGDYHLFLSLKKGKGQAGSFLCNYLQSVSPRLAVGAQVAYEHDNCTAKIVPILTLAGEYKYGRCTGTVSASGTGSVTTTLVRIFGHGRHALAGIITLDIHKLSTLVCTAAYSYIFRSGVARFEVDTTAVIATVDHQLQHWPLQVSLSAIHALSLGESKFGVGLNYSGPC